MGLLSLTFLYRVKITYADITTPVFSLLKMTFVLQFLTLLLRSLNQWYVSKTYEFIRENEPVLNGSHGDSNKISQL